MDDAEHEANLQEALTNKNKVVKLVVEKWFVDKGFGYLARTRQAKSFFIHASVVQVAEVLMVSTDAWAPVVSDHARAEGGGVEPERLGEGSLGNRRGCPASKTGSDADGRTGSSVRGEDLCCV